MMGPVATEIEHRLWVIADPKVVWVHGRPPWRHDEVCLAYNGQRNGPVLVLSRATIEFLGGFLEGYSNHAGLSGGGRVIDFNDSAADRREIVLMLEEALDQAIWEGV